MLIPKCATFDQSKKFKVFEDSTDSFKPDRLIGKLLNPTFLDSTILYYRSVYNSFVSWLKSHYDFTNESRRDDSLKSNLPRFESQGIPIPFSFLQKYGWLPFKAHGTRGGIKCDNISWGVGRIGETNAIGYIGGGTCNGFQFFHSR